MGFSWCMGFQWVSVDPTFLYGAGGVGGGAGAWWFYIAVAIAPITAIIQQYIIIGIIIISISSTFLRPPFYIHVFMSLYFTICVL